MYSASKNNKKKDKDEHFIVDDVQELNPVQTVTNTKIYDIIEDEYNTSREPNMIDRWEKFFSRYQKSVKNNNNSKNNDNNDTDTILDKPYINQIIGLSTAEPYIYKREYNDIQITSPYFYNSGNKIKHSNDSSSSSNTNTNIGTKIFFIDYNDLVYSKTDYMNLYDYDDPNDDIEFEKTSIDVKVLCYQIRYDFESAINCIRHAVMNLLKKFDPEYAELLMSRKTGVGGLDKIQIVVHNYELTK